MKTYYVRYRFYGEDTVEVEAESEDEALKLVSEDDEIYSAIEREIWIVEDEDTNPK